MNCPKCGFEQNNGPECLHCGIIFARYHAVAELPRRSAKPDQQTIRPSAGLFRRFFRIFRWVSLTGGVTVLFLMLRTSQPPQIEASPEATQRAEAKIEEFQSTAGSGTEYRLEMDEPELNGWLKKNLALKGQPGATPAPQTTESLIEMAKVATGGRSVSAEDLEQVRSSIRDVKIEIQESSLRIYALFDLHGIDLSLELEGQPVCRDGYMKLEPTGGKFGSFPLTSVTLNSVADRLFESPENKEKFRLPPHIRDIRIEHGQFVIISR